MDTQEPTGRKSSLLRSPWLWAILAGVIAIPAIRPLLIHRPDPPAVGWSLPEYTLTDQHGKDFGSAELAGDVYVASFFFTRCVTICPPLMRAMGQLHRRLEEDGIEGIRLIGITVDPEHDTPEKLAEYADVHGVDGERWRLLTGDPEEIRALLEDGFKVGMGSPETTAGLFNIAHSGKFVIVDQQGGHRGFYGTNREGLDEIFHRSQHVLRDKRSR